MTGVGSAPAAGASAGAASPPSAASAEEQITPASSLGLLREEAGDASLSLSDPCEAESADRSASRCATSSSALATSTGGSSPFPTHSSSSFAPRSRPSSCSAACSYPPSLILPRGRRGPDEGAGGRPSSGGSLAPHA